MAVKRAVQGESAKATERQPALRRVPRRRSVSQDARECHKSGALARRCESTMSIERQPTLERVPHGRSVSHP